MRWICQNLVRRVFLYHTSIPRCRISSQIHHMEHVKARSRPGPPFHTSASREVRHWLPKLRLPGYRTPFRPQELVAIANAHEGVKLLRCYMDLFSKIAQTERLANRLGVDDLCSYSGFAHPAVRRAG